MSAFQSKSVCFHFKFPVWPRQPEPCGIEETVRPCTLKVLVRCPVGLGDVFSQTFVVVAGGPTREIKVGNVFVVPGRFHCLGRAKTHEERGSRCGLKQLTCRGMFAGS
jgi:hypothetical protein